MKSIFFFSSKVKTIIESTIIKYLPTIVGYHANNTLSGTIVSRHANSLTNNSLYIYCLEEVIFVKQIMVKLKKN